MAEGHQEPEDHHQQCCADQQQCDAKGRKVSYAVAYPYTIRERILKIRIGQNRNIVRFNRHVLVFNIYVTILRHNMLNYLPFMFFRMSTNFIYAVSVTILLINIST